MSGEMQLCRAEIGGEYTVGSINLRKDTARRLEMLGMTKGTRIKVLGAKRSGPMIVKVRGTRFAVGKSFTEGIYIRKSGGI